jgi:hypothetical protein
MDDITIHDAIHKFANLIRGNHENFKFQSGFS